MRARSALRLALLAWVFCAACDIRLPDGVLRCDATHRCPEGQFCHDSDGLCHSSPPIGESDSGTDAETQPSEVMPDAGGAAAPENPPKPDASAPMAGSQADPTPSCESTQSCAQTCVAGSLRCSDGKHVERCDDEGNWQAGETCASGCMLGSTTCGVCAPGTKRCEGKRPQVCRQDGGAWVDNGAPCTADCVEGECPSCEVGDAPRCRGDAIEHCTDVNVWQTKESCGEPTPTCVMGKCLLCAPDSARCRGTSWEVCSADGSTWTKQIVRKDICGAACDPGEARCIGQAFQRCAVEGIWSDPSLTVGECGVVCSSGESSCAGSVPRACNATHTGWDEQPVQPGMCGAECMPNQSECIGTQFRSCGDAGHWSNLSITPPKCGAVCNPRNVRCSGTTPQACNSEGSAWTNQTPQVGTCDCNKPAPPGFGGSCGSCGGKVQCDGSCSVVTPANFGKPCGSCGGTVQCDGTCSVATPETFGQGCGSCGGTLGCGGGCSVPTPSDIGQPCGSCGGSVQCNGSCSVGTPSNIGQPCGSCGGSVLCDGSCSVATPGDIGQPCGDCGGTRQCNGTCSIVFQGQSCPARCCEPNPCGGCDYCVSKATLCDFR